MKDKDTQDKKKETLGKITYMEYLNGKLIGKGTKPFYNSWKVDDSGAKSIGIGMINPAYIETNELQDKEYEYIKIKKFLQKYANEYANQQNLDVKKINIEFINYGKTELVYVLTEPTGKRVTLLVKQPAVEFGKVKQEADNLIKLNKVDKNVIAPIDYYKFGDQELYVTPYINQARCVASYGTWGMYIPDPYYRFESFSPDQEKVVNTCMIGKLVSLFNFENNTGIASCKLGGGDFMLPKGWEDQTPTIENTLNSLYLIASREMINCSFDKYLEIIRDEFSRRTIDENQDNLQLNLRGRVPIDLDTIEQGIELGKQLIANKETTSTQTDNHTI